MFHLKSLRYFFYERLLASLPCNNNPAFVTHPVPGMMMVLNPERDTEVSQCAFDIV
jgi:hypothetical protein